MESNCLFCKIVAGEIPADTVYADDDFLAFLDINPINLGHTLLIPRKHFRNLFDLPEPLLAKAAPNLQKIATAVKQATKADGINLGMNNEPAAGQLIFHAHFHIIPRFAGDGVKHWQGKTKPTAEALKAIGEKIGKII